MESGQQESSEGQDGSLDAKEGKGVGREPSRP